MEPSSGRDPGVSLCYGAAGGWDGAQGPMRTRQPSPRAFAPWPHAARVAVNRLLALDSASTWVTNELGIILEKKMLREKEGKGMKGKTPLTFSALDSVIHPPYQGRELALVPLCKERKG